ncbi:MAG: sulfotransferase [Halieaceae bacterium]
MTSASSHQNTLRSAHQALASGDFQQAHTLTMGVLQEAPSTAEGYFIMALIAHRHGNVAKAEEIIQRALGFAEENVDYLLFQAQCLLELSRHEDAKAAVALLAKRPLATALQNDTLGVLHSRLGQHGDALPLFQKACDLSPDTVSMQYNLASCLQFSGAFDDAEKAYEKAIQLDANNYRSHSSLSQLRRHTDTDNHIPRLQALWPTLGEDADARLHVGHALAKEYEDLENYEQAFHWLQQANSEKLKGLESRGEQNSALFSALHTLSSELAESEIDGHPSEEPIFIVGMPRTGTTLIERILSSHSEVESAGELANFSLLVKKQLQTESQWVLDVETIQQAGKLDFEKLGRDYLESTRHLTGGSAHFIDKMPLNFMYVPMIAKALPNARIICLRRNPMDTCLSNYRQLFSTNFSYYNYAYSLTDTAEFYAQFQSLMDHLGDVPGDRFLQISYEAVVDNPEAETRRLLSHCGLPWQEQCLQFHSNTAPVATASSVQVREKIYTRAVERWRHYEPWLGDVKAVFEAHGILWD